MSQPAEWPLARYIPLLRVQARQLRLRLDKRLQVLLGESDLIQETMLRAHKGYAEFGGKGVEAIEVKWLQVIMANVCRDKIESAKAAKSPVMHEQSIRNLVARSSANLDTWLADEGASPSLTAERNESLQRMMAAIHRLPEDQRDAVILRDIEKLTIAEVVSELKRTGKPDCTPRAVGGLLRRGRARLRQLLQEHQ